MKVKNYRHLEEWDNGLAIKPVLKSVSEKMIRKFIMKDSIIAIYIAVNIKYTNFCIYGWMLLKIPIILKKGSNKNCWEFNFLQKTQ